jgi:DNA-binding CsgD family transcriptional regulator
MKYRTTATTDVDRNDTIPIATELPTRGTDISRRLSEISLRGGIVQADTVGYSNSYTTNDIVTRSEEPNRNMPSDIALLEMKEDIAYIKGILKQQQKDMIKDTDVYLTPAEHDVLYYISLGYTNIEIAYERYNNKNSNNNTTDMNYKTIDKFSNINSENQNKTGRQNTTSPSTAKKVNVGGVTRIIQNLYRKTSTTTRTELLRWAIETGHISRKIN